MHDCLVLFGNLCVSFLQVASPFPPSDKIGINSVQREAEEIVPMKRMKMDWIPYIPLEKRYPTIWWLLYWFLTDFKQCVTLIFLVSNWKFFYFTTCGIWFFCRGSQVDRLKSQIFILGCTQRRYSCIHFFSLFLTLEGSNLVDILPQDTSVNLLQ